MRRLTVFAPLVLGLGLLVVAPNISFADQAGDKDKDKHDVSRDLHDVHQDVRDARRDVSGVRRDQAAKYRLEQELRKDELHPLANRKDIAHDLRQLDRLQRDLNRDRRDVRRDYRDIRYDRRDVRRDRHDLSTGAQPLPQP